MENEFEIPGIDEIEGLQDLDPDPEPDPKDTSVDYNSVISQLTERANKAEESSRKAQSRADQVVDRYSKLATHVVKKDIGSYDEETGEIKFHEQKESPPDYESQIKTLTSEIKAKKAEINKRYNEGEIDEHERDELFDEQVTPLTDQRTDLKLEAKVTKFIPKPESGAADITTTPQSSEDKKSGFDKLLSDYPEADQAGSELRNAMLELLEKDSSFDINKVIYGKEDPVTGRIIEYTGDPSERRRLVEAASKLIETRTSAAKEKAQSSTAEKFSGPEEAAFHQPSGIAGLGKTDVENLVKTGFNDKGLIREINTHISSYLKSGEIILPG